MLTDEMRELWPPWGAEPLVSFRVVGEPKPAGSKNAIPLMRFDRELGRRVPIVRDSGVPIVNVTDSSGRAGTEWRADVRAACVAAMDEAQGMVDGPVAVRVTFFRSRPASHYGTGRNAGVLKDSAPAFPHQSKLPDGTKLGRSLEDALNKICWADDRRVCDMWWSRRFGPDGAEVAIFTLPVRAAPSIDMRATVLRQEALAL